jgi:LPS sulfotransferase NodH
VGDLTKFVILGHGRTGSTLLTHALRAHPNVRMYGEIFHDDPAERRTSLRTEEPAYADGTDAGRYLAEVIFRPRWWRTLKAVGFKLFYDHARDSAGALRAWEHLVGDRSVRIVHVSRWNLMEAWLSYQVARQTGVWVRAAGEASARPRVEPIVIRPAECREFFEFVAERRGWVREAFREHATIEVEYERDLVRAFGPTLARVASFLGVRRFRIAPPIERQRQGPARGQIANFEELCDHFRGTPHEAFFAGS